ncbi:hypothetical protein D3C87_984010 [compost metagenome]
MLIHVVSQHPDMRMLDQHISQRLQLVMRIGSARGVGRRVENEPLGLRRDRLFQRFRLQLEIVFERRVDKNRRTTADRHHFRVAHPVRRGNDNFITRVQRGHEGVEEDLLAARADNRLLRLVVQPVFTLELVGNGLAQFRNAGNRRVFRFTALDGVDGRFLDIFGRIEIRLAGAKADHIAALRFQLTGFLGNSDGGGWLYAGENVGKEGHF